MDFSTLIPIIIFLYAVSTIFGSDSSKNQKKGPPNRQGPNNRPQPGRPKTPQRESKPSGFSWQEMFEELERELFPKEEKVREPRSTANEKTYQSSTPTYIEEGAGGVEGVGGVEGLQGVEGTTSPYTPVTVQVSHSQVLPSVRESQPSTSRENQVSSPPSGFPTSGNPLVQGVIWAEVLGKPRSRDGWGYKGRNF